MSKFVLRIILLHLFSISTYIYGQGQRTCPTIILASSLGQAMDSRFDSVYGDLSRYGVVYAPITIQKVTFLRLLNKLRKVNNTTDNTVDGFRIYIAQNEVNQIKFIFTGLRDDNDTKLYFVLSPTGNSFNALPKDIAESWVRRFQDLTLPKLNPDNLDQGNTRSYAYFKGLLRKYILELRFQDAGSPVKSIKMKLSVYINNNSNPGPNNTPSYENRIMVGFTFVGNNGEIFLDQLGGHYGCSIPKDKWTGTGLDTGTPCPPNSCIGTTLGRQ